MDGIQAYVNYTSINSQIATHINWYLLTSLAFINGVGIGARAGHEVEQHPMQVDEFNHEQRLQILAAYTQNGVELARIYPGSTDAGTTAAPLW